MNALVSVNFTFPTMVAANTSSLWHIYWEHKSFPGTNKSLPFQHNYIIWELNSTLEIILWSKIPLNYETIRNPSGKRQITTEGCPLVGSMLKACLFQNKSLTSLCPLTLFLPDYDDGTHGINNSRFTRMFCSLTNQRAKRNSIKETPPSSKWFKASLNSLKL